MRGNENEMTVPCKKILNLTKLSVKLNDHLNRMTQLQNRMR